MSFKISPVALLASLLYLQTAVLLLALGGYIWLASSLKSVETKDDNLTPKVVAVRERLETADQAEARRIALILLQTQEVQTKNVHGMWDSTLQIGEGSLLLGFVATAWLGAIFWKLRRA